MVAPRAPTSFAGRDKPRPYILVNLQPTPSVNLQPCLFGESSISSLLKAPL